ncbi:cation:proton antiporter [Kitasatospora aureofaciens]|uniref:cation:proton antiporter n=1 Tax=Kitasatospora aureofaciens TaxID=1894 RepID=UPI001C449017|nr:cation:proton antiporter [Kitasatospora aureofaciens]MBV6699794.1 cation:proton antiporter [Kitasatospora aureofaciens]
MTAHQVQWLFLGLVAILTLSGLFGAAARRLGQPAVVGEILAGILIGPSLFGGAVADALLPADIRPALTALANLGLALFMFAIGYELRFAELRGRSGLAVRVSVFSVALPFVLGVLLALGIAGAHPVRSRAGFVLFLGAAMSVTAFPVLARILADRGLDRTRLGGVALAGAALSDLFAWGLLGLAVTVAGAAGQQRMLLVPVYLAVMSLGVRPLLKRVFAGADEHGVSPAMIGALLVALLLSCWATEWMGIHFIFGAFLLGAIAPRGGRRDLSTEVTGRFEAVSGLLLPAYFVLAATRVNLAEVGLSGIGELALILLTAVIGKFAGAYAGARVSAVPKLQSAALATLMNARGLTEIVILTVGLQLAVIDTQLYSLLVVMALVTTAMAGPVLQLLERRAGGDARRLGDFEYDHQSLGSVPRISSKTGM